MKEKLSNTLIVRVNDTLKNDLSNIQDECGVVISEFIRQCLNSMVSYYKKNDSITMPIVVIPKKDYLALAKTPTKAKAQKASKE